VQPLAIMHRMPSTCIPETKTILKVAEFIEINNAFETKICYLLIRFDLQIYTLGCSPLTVNSGEVVGIPGGHWCCECIPRWPMYPVDAGSSSHHHWRVTDPHLIHRGPWKIPRRNFLSMLLPGSEKLRFQKEAKGSTSNHQCSGAMYVSGRVGGCCSL